MTQDQGIVSFFLGNPIKKKHGSLHEKLRYNNFTTINMNLFLHWEFDGFSLLSL